MHLPLHHTHTPTTETRQIKGVLNYPFILLAGIGTIVLCSLTGSIPLLIDFGQLPLRSVLLIVGATVVDVGYAAIVLMLYRRLHARRLTIDDQGFRLKGLKGDTHEVRWDEIVDVRILYSFMENRRVLAGYQIRVRDGFEVSVPRFGRSAGQVYLELVGGTINAGLRGLIERLKTEGVVVIGEIEVTVSEVRVGQRRIPIDSIAEIKSRLPAEPEIQLKIEESPLSMMVDLYDPGKRQTVPKAYLLPVFLRALKAARQPVAEAPPSS